MKTVLHVCDYYGTYFCDNELQDKHKMEDPQGKPAATTSCLKQLQKHWLYGWLPTAHLTEQTLAATPALAPPLADAHVATDGDALSVALASALVPAADTVFM